MTKRELKELQAKPWHLKTRREQDVEAAAYDRMTTEEMIRLSRPPTKAELRRLDRKPTKAQYDRAQAKRGRGRPRVGKGAKRVLVSLEQGLLARADAFARSRQWTRSQLITRSLESIIRSAG